MRKDTVKRISRNSDSPKMRSARRFPVVRVRLERSCIDAGERIVVRLDDPARRDATDDHPEAFAWTHLPPRLARLQSLGWAVSSRNL